jgi:hypothetical protein
MSDVLMCNQLLVAHLCHLMLLCLIAYGSSLAGVQQTKQKEMVFSGTTPSQVLLNHFMTSIWIQ